MSNAELMTAALFGLEHQRSDIEGKMADIRRAIRSTDLTKSAAMPTRIKRTMSAAARRRIAAAQRKRWAAVKAQGTKAAPAKAAPKKHTMSAAARKRIGEATKKRWAEFRKKKAGKET